MILSATANQSRRPFASHFSRCSMMFLVLAAFAGSCELCLASWRPSERLLHAVRYVESANGRYTYGDNGRSLGDYQMSEAAWIDVTAWRKTQNLPTYEYGVYVWNRRVSRVYAADYLAILHRELRKRMQRAPTSAEVYAAYNMGLAGFAQCNFQLARVNRTTAAKCQLIKDLTREQ
jgi:hypothetical protein